MPRKALRKIRPQQINRKLPTLTHYPPAPPASHNPPGTLVIFTMPRINAASPRTRPDTPRARILRTPHAPAQPPAILALCATHHRSKPRRHPPPPAMLAPRSTTTAATTPHLPTQFHMSPRRQPPINKIQFTRRPTLPRHNLPTRGSLFNAADIAP